ncbi:MAG: hypothetical protein BWZ10_03432 [candidate division BRC1 bacterium ADurb.BinA364]|nr:MAG: hypothetical protein BWZ10_03432 [candidate division BRC1 bacterium ADurb.BinA364]
MAQVGGIFAVGQRDQPRAMLFHQCLFGGEVDQIGGLQDAARGGAVHAGHGAQFGFAGAENGLGRAEGMQQAMEAQPPDVGSQPEQQPRVAIAARLRHHAP